MKRLQKFTICCLPLLSLFLIGPYNYIVEFFAFHNLLPLSCFEPIRPIPIYKKILPGPFFSSTGSTNRWVGLRRQFETYYENFSQDLGNRQKDIRTRIKATRCETLRTVTNNNSKKTLTFDLLPQCIINGPKVNGYNFFHF